MRGWGEIKMKIRIRMKTEGVVEVGTIFLESGNDAGGE